MKKFAKKVIFLLFSLSLLTLAGCGTPTGCASASAGGSTSRQDPLRVEPLPSTLDLSALAEGDNQFLAGFQGSDIREEDGGLVIDLTVYDYELFDAVDISRLAVGDTLVVKGREIPVESLAEENGGVRINGGLEAGGIDLISAGGGAYRVQLEDDARDLFEVGQITLPVGPDFVLTDDSDPEHPGKTLCAKDLPALGDAVFSPLATTVETVEGKVAAIHRDYLP